MGRSLLRQPWARAVFGVGVMAVGFVSTAGLLILLQKVLTREDTEAVDAVAFDTPPPQKKAPPKRQTKPKPKPKPKPSKAPPPPSLGSALAGMSFGLPQFSDDLLGGGANSLIEDTSNVVMSEDVVDDPPRPVSRSACSYPSRARTRNISGFVTLSLLVKADGSLSDVRVLEAEPAGVFEETALSCIRGWKFEPASYEGQPVAVRARQTLNFVLD